MGYHGYTISLNPLWFHCIVSSVFCFTCNMPTYIIIYRVIQPAAKIMYVLYIISIPFINDDGISFSIVVDLLRLMINSITTNRVRKI